MAVVSVIVPCYNQGPYIEECLTSLKNQTYGNIEVIIVNDGSTDPYTIKKLNELKNTYLNFNFYDINNSGVSNARNFGISKSNGIYILPLDADDKIADNYIEKCVNIIESKKVDIVYALGALFGEKKGLWYLPRYSKEKIIKSNMVHCSALFRKKDFYECGGYNENMVHGFEDWDLWLSMTEKNKTFYRIDEVLFFYRIKKVSRNSTVLEGRKLEKTVKQLMDNHPTLYKGNELKIENPNKNLVKRILIKFKYEIKKMLLKMSIVIWR